mgnify:CR=1 FL=1|jgi:hypothetical protein
MNLLYLKSDKIGADERSLGKKLLIAFLKNLAASEQQVDVIGCISSGVMLTTHEGKALDYLRILESKGAKIVSCGTCLDHYGLSKNLLIGELGNMAMNVEVMYTYDRIINPC